MCCKIFKRLQCLDQYYTTQISEKKKLKFILRKTGAKLTLKLWDITCTKTWNNKMYVTINYYHHHQKMSNNVELLQSLSFSFLIKGFFFKSN